MVLATIIQCLIVCAATQPPEQPNAADAWNELFKELENIPYIEDESGSEIPYYENDNWDNNAHALQEQMSPLVTRAREIANMEHCDWGLDYSQGFDMLLPHLGRIREVQKILQYSIRAEVDKGNTSSALSEIDTMLGVTSHNLGSKTIIGSLVANSCFNLATSEKGIIDSVEDAEQLEALLVSVNRFDEFDPFGLRGNIGDEKEMAVNWMKNTENIDFSIFDSITGKETNPQNLDMDEEIKKYSSAMERMESIFQMTDRDAAFAASEQIDAELAAGKLSFLVISSKNLLEAAFRAEETVADFKQLLRDKIDMIRSPNSATYFLKAVESYNAIDSEERRKAIEQGDFSVIEAPRVLFAKACSMPVKQITLNDDIVTPMWIAPLYSLAIDCLSRGTDEDTLAVSLFVGHLSQQQRFESSIIAGVLCRMLGEDIPLQAFQKIPIADAFMLIRNAGLAKNRVTEYFCLDNGSSWNAADINVLACTLTVSKLEGVNEYNPSAWLQFVDALGAPDSNAVIELVVEDLDIEALSIIELPEGEAFENKLTELQKSLARVRKSSRPKDM